MATAGRVRYYRLLVWGSGGREALRRRRGEGRRGLRRASIWGVGDSERNMAGYEEKKGNKRGKEEGKGGMRRERKEDERMNNNKNWEKKDKREKMQNRRGYDGRKEDGIGKNKRGKRCGRRKRVE